MSLSCIWFVTHRSPPTSTPLVSPPTINDFHQPPLKSADLHWPPRLSTDLHRPPMTSADLHQSPLFPPKDVNASIFGRVGAKIVFECIAILKYSCMWSSYSKCSKYAIFLVCTFWFWEECETFCAMLTNNVIEAAKKRDRLGCFLM